MDMPDSLHYHARFKLNTNTYRNRALRRSAELTTSGDHSDSSSSSASSTLWRLPSSLSSDSIVESSTSDRVDEVPLANCEDLACLSGCNSDSDDDDDDTPLSTASKDKSQQQVPAVALAKQVKAGDAVTHCSRLIAAVAFDFDGTLIAGHTCMANFNANAPQFRIHDIVAEFIRWCVAHRVHVAIFSHGITERVLQALARVFKPHEIDKLHVFTPKLVGAELDMPQWRDGELPPHAYTRASLLRLFRQRIGWPADLPTATTRWPMLLVDDTYEHTLSAVEHDNCYAVWLRSCTLVDALEDALYANRINTRTLPALTIDEFYQLWTSACMHLNDSGAHFCSREDRVLFNC
jgi:hypothetical protein